MQSLKRHASTSTVHGKIREIDELKAIAAKAKQAAQKVVFTNGCFDLLHRGHIYLLREAKKLGDVLIVAVNRDSSVKAIKGPSRPIVPEVDRAELIAALEMVDYVILFGDSDPYHLIQELKPDVLVKGGDWPEGTIVGADVVEGARGKVVVIPYLEGYSTTRIIERMHRK